MLAPEQIRRIQPKLLTVQALAGALILGAIVFAAVMSLMVDWENLNDQVKMLTLMASVSGLFLFVISVFVPIVFGGSSNGFQKLNEPLKDSQIDAVVSMLITETLIRYALIEGGVMLNLMVLIIDPHLVLIVVAGIGLLLMLASFPRQSKMISTIEQRA